MNGLRSSCTFVANTALVLTLTALGCNRDAGSASTSPAPSASALARSSVEAERLTLTEAQYKAIQASLLYHRLLPTPAFAITSPSLPAPGKATAIFGAIPDKPVGAFTAPILGIVVDMKVPRAEQVELVSDSEGNLVTIDAFEERDALGSEDDGHHSAPTPTGPGKEILLVATFSAKETGAPFKRGVHLIWTPSHHLVQSLASYAVRHDATVTDLPSLRSAIQATGDTCPDLANDMSYSMLALALQCMLAHDRRQQLARAFAYPIDVLLRSGEVRTLHNAEQLVEVYDDVIHEAARAGVREVAFDPEKEYAWEAYDGLRLGHAGLVVELTYGLVDDKPVPPRIAVVLNDDPVAQAKWQAKVSHGRSLWKGGRGDVMCRTDVATHVFMRVGHSYRLATWRDPKASYLTRPPDRVLFGVLAAAGSAGNMFFDFIGPSGEVVKFENIVLYGPGPAWEYQVRSPAGDEPCKNHERYEGE